jgi:uncharacterized protein YbaA (DUF1428 family)
LPRAFVTRAVSARSQARVRANGPNGTRDAWAKATKEETMAYVDGFVIAVPNANKQRFIEHAKKADEVFLEYGATRVLECWGDDVPSGKQTDFRRAVQANEDEAVLFSWIEWPDKSTRDAAMPKVMEDPRLKPENNPMPFDGTRMIFGGFSPVVELEK